MKWLKLAIGIVLLIVAIAAILRVNSCVNDWHGVGRLNVDVPRDSSFMPTDHRHYQPPSLPGLSTLVGSPPPAKLPKGVRERDVHRVVSLELRERKKSIGIIEMKDGTVFVAKDSAIQNVTITDYEAPILSFGIFPGIGLSLGPQRVSPLAKISLIELWGIGRLPMLTADLDGAGIGGEFRLYHDIYIGSALVWRYEDMTARSLKLTINYNFQ